MTTLFFFSLLAGSLAHAQNPPWYRPWVAGGAGDQSVAVPVQNSGLVGWRGLAINQVQDTDLANIARPAVQMQRVPAVWVFGQCFGGGMFDELNALGRIQSPRGQQR